MQDGSPRPRAATLMPQRRAASRSPKSPWLTHPSEGGAHATKMTSRRERCPRPRASTVDCFAALSEPATFDVRFVGARAGHPAIPGFQPSSYMYHVVRRLASQREGY